MDLREVEELIADVESRLDRLRALYDQYFMGFERLEPLVPRKEVDRRMYLLRKEHIRNTRLRFRFNMLVQRYNMFQAQWARVCRQIEEGTYRRQILRAKRRLEESSRSQHAHATRTASNPSLPASTAPASPPLPVESPATRSTHPITDERLNALYGDYMDRRRSAGDDTPAVSLEKMKRTVIETETRLRKTHGREVDFRVEIIEGVAVLRPVLK
jgi:hypothetical protein